MDSFEKQVELAERRRAIELLDVAGCYGLPAMAARYARAGLSAADLCADAETILRLWTIFAARNPVGGEDDSDDELAG